MDSISSGPKTITLIEDTLFSKETDTESYRKNNFYP